jgi:mevalonate kinase
LLKLTEAVLKLFAETGQGVRIVMQSTIPMGRGMGSGAAVSVALVRALCAGLNRKLNAKQICELARIAEKEFHGSPSGVDSAVVAYDAPVYFVKGRPVRSISINASTFHFLVADTGIESPTIEVVTDVCAAREKNRATYDSFFWEIGSLASVSRKILDSGSPMELGLCMNRCHRALQLIGVSCPELDRLVAVAMAHGALGAKMSGAGRGGAMIVLLRNSDDADRIGAELTSAGAETIFATKLAKG